MRGNEIYARIGPADLGGKRPFGLLGHRELPDDLFDERDVEQEALDAGEFSDEFGMWRGKQAAGESNW